MAGEDGESAESAGLDGVECVEGCSAGESRLLAVRPCDCAGCGSVCAVRALNGRSHIARAHEVLDRSNARLLERREQEADQREQHEKDKADGEDPKDEVQAGRLREGVLRADVGERSVAVVGLDEVVPYDGTVLDEKPAAVDPGASRVAVDVDGRVVVLRVFEQTSEELVAAANVGEQRVLGLALLLRAVERGRAAKVLEAEGLVEGPGGRAVACTDTQHTTHNTILMNEGELAAKVLEAEGLVEGPGGRALACTQHTTHNTMLMKVGSGPPKY